MLTDQRINNARPTTTSYRLRDGRSLSLEVKPSGLKSWTYRYRLGGKQGVVVLGNYYDGRVKPEDHVSAEEARRLRNEARALVKQGKNPAQQWRAEKQLTIIESAITFRSVAQSWIEDNKPHWSEAYLYKATTFLGNNVFSFIGNIPLRDLTSAHVLDVLQRIEKRGAHSVALEVRGMISAVFRFAIPRSLADTDPAAPLKGVIKRPAVENKTPMTEDDIKDFLKKLETQPRPMQIALRLALMMFPRPGNVSGAEWSEFDLDKAEWTIPAEKMKTRKPFVTPLPRQAVALLRELKELTGSQRWLFPNRDKEGEPIDRTTLNKVMHRIFPSGKFTPHCFRATAGTLLVAHKYPVRVIEKQFAHAQDTVAAAYLQFQYFEERRDMLQRYATLIDQWAMGIAVVKGVA